MRQEEMERLVEAQRAFFAQGKTKKMAIRSAALNRLREEIRARSTDIEAALRDDLGKSAMEGYFSEVGLVLSELNFMLRHASSLAQKRRVRSSLAQKPGISYVQHAPYGTVLIISPWNYPFLLTLQPLVDALAAGNTAVLKLSSAAPCTAQVVEEIIHACFDECYVAVVRGGRSENQSLLRMPFDMMFFTGSEAVGREVARCAAEHLTPVVLELGGKSPCLVERTAKLELAARRIVFGKFLNCGQTCVAPDYVLVEECIHDALIDALCRETVRQFGVDPLKNEAYGHIINQRHFMRLCGLMNAEKTVLGGTVDPVDLRIAPTLMDNVAWDDAVMQEEIFGPILPILPVRDMDEAAAMVCQRSKPLALYLFTENPSLADAITEQCDFGGGCINDTVIHLATPHMGFGGVGASGMGAYHGEAGFRAFGHEKSMVKQSTHLDLPLRYQPYTSFKERLLRFLMH